MPPARLYRVREVADLLALKPDTVYRLIAAKTITIIKPTRRSIRISEQEILRIQRDGIQLRDPTKVVATSLR
jgi:excisionase family DNA binding protein